jgi:hypothetical protein
VPLAIYLLTQHKNGISAMASRRQLGVSYKAAWLLKYELMLYRDFLWSQVLVERNSDFALGGITPIDDAYLGGERSGGESRAAARKTCRRL